MRRDRRLCGFGSCKDSRVGVIDLSWHGGIWASFLWGLRSTVLDSATHVCGDLPDSGESKAHHPPQPQSSHRITHPIGTMEDQELAAIRAARLQQLRQNASNSSGSPLPQVLPTGGTGGDPEAEAKRADEEQMRRDLLATVLDTKARERREHIFSPVFRRSRLVDELLATLQLRA